jgi:hypothetical protein
MGLLEDIGAYVDTNTSLTLGSTLYLSMLPETPDDVVAVIEDSGMSPLFTHGAANLPKIERPGVQIIVRNRSYATGRSLSNDIWRLLSQVANQSIGGTLYHRIEPVASPAVYNRDRTYVWFSTNFYVMRSVT